jgi:adenine phosphoribosyltransferase
MTELASKIDKLIRNVPDFPKPGIMFKDITPVIQDGAVFNEIIRAMAEKVKASGATLIAGIESRGFIFGAALAHELGYGFILLRKPGKLPWRTVRATYQLEYGSDAIEMHEDAVKPGDKVVIVDDLLATGGTATAAACLIKEAGADVKQVLFAIELEFLNGREKLRTAGFPAIDSLLKY